MEDILLVLLDGLTNAYILFCAILGIYAAVLGGQNEPLSGNFWGAMWINTGLAAVVFVVAGLLALVGQTPDRGWLYFFYTFYFVISLPGVYAILQGNDNRVAAFSFGVVALFNSAAAFRADSLLF